METLTIAEAADATGRSKKAIRNRVDRGQLRAVLRDGVRRIPRSEVDRLCLVEADGEAAIRQEAGPGQGRGASGWSELLERLERQAGELAELRTLTREAESLRDERELLQAALHETRAKVTELEAQLPATPPRRWWRRRPAPA